MGKERKDYEYCPECKEQVRYCKHIGVDLP